MSRRRHHSPRKTDIVARRDGSSHLKKNARITLKFRRRCMCGGELVQLHGILTDDYAECELCGRKEFRAARILPDDVQWKDAEATGGEAPERDEEEDGFRPVSPSM